MSDSGSVYVSRVEVSQTFAGTALFCFDSILLLQTEIAAGTYWSYGPRSAAITIYRIMKMFAVLFLVCLLYTRTYDHVSTTGCLLGSLISSSVVDVGYPAIIKILLVLRLRALYQHERKVTVLLYFLLTVELLSTTLAFCGAAIFNINYRVIIFGFLPGCHASNTVEPRFMTLYWRSEIVAWTSRFSTTTIEVILMLYKLCEALREKRRMSRNSLWSTVTEMQSLTPVLYIFYRDGTLLFVPIFVIICLGFYNLIQLQHDPDRSVVVDWGLWLTLTYQILGSRLILNIRLANRKLMGSMIPQYLSDLRFAPPESHDETEWDGRAEL